MSLISDGLGILILLFYTLRDTDVFLLNERPRRVVHVKSGKHWANSHSRRSEHDNPRVRTQFKILYTFQNNMFVLFSRPSYACMNSLSTQQ